MGLVWFGLVLMAYQLLLVIQYQIMFFIYIRCMISKNILKIYTVKWTNSSISNEFNLSLVNNIKWFQGLLRITNNSMKHQPFVYTQLNHKTLLFPAIQFSMPFVCLKFYLTYHLLPLRGPSEPESNGKEGVHRRLQYIIYRTFIGGILQQRCSWCILPSEETGLIYVLLVVHISI